MRRARRRVDLLAELGPRLLGIDKPARYVGGEYGALPALSPAEEPDLLVALSFPDLYEIGMSNNAIRLLYQGLNRRPGLRCERVFAPAPDFEALLRESSLPLATLETGFAVGEAELLGFSVGYELAATNILTILDRSGIPLLAAERGEGQPIVIGGGPALSNPHFLADFLDAVWIGEAEEAFFELCEELAALRRGGAGRAALLEGLSASPHIWRPGKKARRAVFAGFPASDYRMVFPVPVFKAVQAHGTVEIMRGCPHGCRFCHAGFYYRPQRMKDAPRIQEEVRDLVRKGGYREITLSSLSSGDYAGIGELLAALNAEWAEEGVSFQLPSLKVNTFTLPLLEALSEVRKSGLTFAVESPEDFRQLVINKDVNFDKIVDILGEARKRGFRSAKFYFMIGLPVPGRGRGEAEAIVDFFSRLTAIHPIGYSVNVGVFVPKPHTPFQWCGQLGEEEAMEAIQVLRAGLRPFRSVKLAWHSPFVSLLESVLARGDERVGGLILEAWKRGARLDAWEEHFDRERWRGVLTEAAWNPIREAEEERDREGPLPWDDVSILVSRRTLLREWERSQAAVFTSACLEECTSPCGVCGDLAEVVYNKEQPKLPELRAIRRRSEQAGRLLIRYSKQGRAPYYPHLGIMDAMARALQIAALPLSYSEGYNPAPRIELLPPLPMGLASADDYASVILAQVPEEGGEGWEALRRRIQAALPEGLEILELRFEPAREDGRRHPSLAAGLAANDYLLRSTSLELGALWEGLSSLARAQGLELTLLAGGVDALRLRYPNPPKREASLLRLLEELLGAQPLARLRIERSLARRGPDEAWAPLGRGLGFQVGD